ncbi:hypothetical protein Bhyg_07885, partial [Pseudolycoriella hygida]
MHLSSSPELNTLLIEPPTPKDHHNWHPLWGTHQKIRFSFEMSMRIGLSDGQEMTSSVRMLAETLRSRILWEFHAFRRRFMDDWAVTVVRADTVDWEAVDKYICSVLEEVEISLAQAMHSGKDYVNERMRHQNKVWYSCAINALMTMLEKGDSGLPRLQSLAPTKTVKAALRGETVKMTDKLENDDNSVEVGSNKAVERDIDLPSGLPELASPSNFAERASEEQLDDCQTEMFTPLEPPETMCEMTTEAQLGREEPCETTMKDWPRIKEPGVKTREVWPVRKEAESNCETGKNFFTGDIRLKERNSYNDK